METLISSRKQSWLIWFLRGILILSFLILFGKLFELTVIRGEYFRSLANDNRIRRISVIAPRGKIIARGGEILVDNEEIKTNDNDPGIFQDKGVIVEWERKYLLGASIAHISGYLGEVSENELGKISGRCPEKGPRILGSLTGRSGLEEEYDCLLSGVDGELLLEVDAYGENVRVLGRRNPKFGEDLHTNIDSGLQKKLNDLLEDNKAAAIVTTPKGEVLALVSSPSYDSNYFVNSDKMQEREKILNDEELPLFNRVIGGKFHPGSIFKPIVATAALEEDVIDEDFTFTDEGQITIKTIYGDYSYRNWYFTQYGGVEGQIDLTRAIARSTDTFFYKIGEMVGVDDIVSWSEKFGLNRKTGIDIPGEIEGLVPSPDWKMNAKGERWFLGNTYHMSIGQGDLAVTPMEIHSAISAIANGGDLCEPKIVGESKCVNMDIKKSNINFIKEGMKGACSTGGTAYPFFDFEEKVGFSVACKTGTAENVGEEPHAWFTVFAPADDPKIIATILIENGGEGSSVAGPIAREIFNYYFNIQPSVTPIPSIVSEQ